MKISNINGLGSFGIYIDDVDLNNITDEEWKEIGRLHLETLVTIIRGANLNRATFYNLMKKWGDDRLNWVAYLYNKYPWANRHFENILNSDNVDPIDKDICREFNNIRVGTHPQQFGNMLNVTGMKKNGKRMGIFAEGELLWHSNESGDICFTPGIALLGVKGTTRSATGFMTTTDYYEGVSESFRSELDEMILIHNFTPGKINPGLNDMQDNLMYKNICPFPNTEIPLVIQSPGGIKGLHYSFNTVTGIKGMSDQDAELVLSEIRKGLEPYAYDHWYKEDGDLLLFDNSIVQHRRLGAISDRLCYRYAYDYTNIQPEPYRPYFQKSFHREYLNKSEIILSCHL